MKYKLIFNSELLTSIAQGQPYFILRRFVNQIKSIKLVSGHVEWREEID